MNWQQLVHQAELHLQLAEAATLPAIPGVYTPTMQRQVIDVAPEINVNVPGQKQPGAGAQTPSAAKQSSGSVSASPFAMSDVSSNQLATQLQKANPNTSPEFLALAPTFEDAGKKYNIDPRFLAAVAAVETGWGSSKAFRQGNNVMGISDDKGPLGGFGSAANSIYKQAASLAGAAGTAGHYKGVNTISDIARIYAPAGASNDPRGTNTQWPSLVGNIYSKLGGDPNSSVK